MRHWQELTSAELAEAAVDDAIALLPLAAIEQHGPHLPLSTDLDINHGLLERAATGLPRDFPLLVLPPVCVGDSTEHAAFPGTLRLEPETMIRLLIETGRSVAAAGVRRLVLFNTHGGNRAAADVAALALRCERGMLVVKAHYFDFPIPPGQVPEEELRHGLHGGLIETALMLHFKPKAVRRQRAEDAPSLGHRLAGRYRWLAPEGPGAFAWTAGDLNPAGAAGNAAAASPALGRTLAEHYAGALAELLEETRAFSLGDLVPLQRT